MKSLKIALSACFLSLFACSACSDKKENPTYQSEDKIINIPYQQAQNVAANKLFNKVTILPLSSKTGSFVANASKVLVYEKQIFILDTQSNAVKVFNTKGDFLYRLPKNFANNPQNLNFSDIAINTTKQQLAVLDAPRNMLYFFDIKKSKALESHKASLPFYAHRLVPYDEGYWFFKNRQAINQEDSTYFHDLLYTDTNFKFINGYERFTLETGAQVNFALNNPFAYTLTEAKLYNRFLEDTLWKIGKASRELAYKVNFANAPKREVNKTRGNTKDENLAQALKNPENDWAFIAGNIIETDNFLSLEYIEAQKARSFFLNKKLSKAYSIKLITHQTKEGTLALPAPIAAISPTKLIAMIDENAILKMQANNTFKSEWEEHNIYQNIINNGTTYLVIYEL